MNVIIAHDDVLKLVFENEITLIDSETLSPVGKIPLNTNSDKEAKKFRHKFLIAKAEIERLEEDNAKYSCDNKILTRQLESKCNHCRLKALMDDDGK